MKKFFTLLTLFTFSYTSAIAQGSGSWTTLISGTTTDFYAVSAPSPTVCYVAGAAGTIRKTSDGGNTWAAQSSGTSQVLYHIKFTSLLTGYAVGDNATALKTTDGGSTWTQMTLPVSSSVSFRYVYFIDANTGFITGGESAASCILKTTNGGTTWSILPTSSVSSIAIYSIYFTSATDGYATDYQGNIIKTTDGGSSWTSLTSGTTSPLYNIYFTSGNDGLAISRFGDIQSTNDAGTTWSGVSSGTTSALLGIDFSDANHGFVVGGSLATPSSGVILSTTNGGGTWSAYNPGTLRLYRVDLIGSTGYIVGLNGTILKYSDFNISVNVNDSTYCNNTASADITGGTAPFTYAWSTGATTSSIDSLCDGNYTLTVTDANGNQDIVSFIVGTPLNVTISSINASVFSACDGAVSAIASGGTNPYTYLWSNGSTTSSVSGLCAGTYTLTVTDSTGMSVNSSIVITEPADTTYIDSTLVISTPFTNVSISGACDGTASVTASGGTPPYSYSWSTGDTTNSVTGLCSNVYFITVNDSNGQSVSSGVYISEPIIIVLNPLDTIPGDTLVTTPIDTCLINFNFPVDSASIQSYTLLDATHILIEWAIWQNGSSVILPVQYNYSSMGFSAVVLVLNCSGDIRELQTTIIYGQINIVGSVGINAISVVSPSITVYPNPASDYFTIQMPSIKENSQLSIKNILGQTIHTEELDRSLNNSLKQINSSNYGKGIYFIQIIAENKVIDCKKIIIE